MDKVLVIDGQTFELVGVQREGVSAVYRGGGSYVRIGEPHKIERDLAFHRRMEEAGFPVAKLLGAGAHGGFAYFIEASLGERRLGLLFAEDFETQGAVGEAHIAELIAIVEKHIIAQMGTRMSESAWDDFQSGIRLPELCAELPDEARKIRERFARAKIALTLFPFVVTHGDFNAQNLYRDGVIDLEDSFCAPVGYDPLSVLATIDAMPESRDYEFYARYHLSEAHRVRYLGEIDTIARANGLPTFSEHEEDFAFCRWVWLTVGMQRWPRIRQWRYDRFRKRFLS